MTKEEARKIVFKCSNLEGLGFVDALEALGLLKFEDTKEELKQEASKPSISTIIHDNLNYSNGSYLTYADVDNIVNALLRHRYRIIDTDICDTIDRCENVVSSPRPIPYSDWLRDMKEICLEFIQETCQPSKAQKPFDRVAMSKIVKQIKNCIDEWEQVKS